MYNIEPQQLKLHSQATNAFYIMQIYHKATTSQKFIFASHIAPDAISETLEIQIFIGEDAPRPPYVVIARHPLFLETKTLPSLQQCLTETLNRVPDLFKGLGNLGTPYYIQLKEGSLHIVC